MSGEGGQQQAMFALLVPSGQQVFENHLLSTIYNILYERPCCIGYTNSSRRAEGESLYIRYNTAAHVVNSLKNDSSYEFIGEVILKINVV